MACLLFGLPTLAVAQFTTVYNLPGDTLPAVVGSDSQVNIGVGANPGVIQLGEADGSSTNIELNLLGGGLQPFSDAFGDVTVNLHGSNFGALRIHDGAVANYLSGFNDLSIYPHEGSTANLIDGEINAVVIEGGETNITGGLTRFINARGSASTALVRQTGGAVGLIEGGPRVTVEVEAGSLGEARSSSSNLTTITGGTLGRVWQTRPIAEGIGLTLVGTDFALDGIPIAGLNAPGDEATSPVPTDGGVLTSILSDGTPLALEVGLNDGEVSYNGFRLRQSQPPVMPSSPRGVAAGEALAVASGTLPPFAAAQQGSTLLLAQRGEIGEGFRAVGASVTVDGGTLGNNALALPGTTVTQNGGRIGDRFTVRPDATFVMHGGTIGDSLSAVTTFGVIQGTGQIELHGGDFAINGVAVPGLGTPGSTFDVPADTQAWLTGTLEDGTPFAQRGLSAGMRLVAATPVDSKPFVQSVRGPADRIYGAQGGEVVEVLSGGVLGDHFTIAANASVRIGAGGAIGENTEVVGGELILNGGEVHRRTDVPLGGRMIVNEGTIFGEVTVEAGGVVEVNGGSIERVSIFEPLDVFSFSPNSVGGFQVLDGGELLVTGGDISAGVAVRQGGFAKLSGGTHGGVGVNDNRQLPTADPARLELVGASIASLAARDHSTVHLTAGEVRGRTTGGESEIVMAGGALTDVIDMNDTRLRLSGGKVLGRLRLVDFGFDGVPELLMYGAELAIDGTPVALAEGETITIADRDAVVSGVLSDGSRFEFDLTPSSSSTAQDHIGATGLVTFTRVDRMQGDFNDDGVVNTVDFTVWETATVSGNLRADANHDGLIDDIDLAIWARRQGTDYNRLGDFNADGIVNAADYATWRDGDTIRDLDRYYLWRDYFGTSYTAASVPEPKTATLVALSYVVTGWRSRRSEPA
ncbi:MAG: hypothetical protein AAF266_10195 [Planctomycetota bacterium]